MADSAVAGEASAHEAAFERALRRHAEIERRPLAADVAARFEAAALACPDRLIWQSIDDDRGALTYAQLLRASAAAAHGLRARGVAPGTRVAIVLPNVPEFLVAWLAVLRLGAVAVPLNVNLTAPELSHALGLAAPSHVVCDAGLAERLVDWRSGPGREACMIVVGDAPAGLAVPWAALCDAPGSLPATAIDPDQAATILFTSGTTGLPKACVQSHRFWLTMGRVLAERGPTVVRILTDVPLFYLAGLWRFMMAIESGGTLFVARRYSLSRLLDRIARHEIDFFTATDQVARLSAPGWRPAHTIRRVNIAGLRPELQRGLEAMFAAPAREGYGMTEAGAVLYMPFDNDLMVASGSCGIPAPFRRCSVRDESGLEVERGEIGELWVEGPGLCSGYFRNAAATASLFEGSWLRTGDLFRQDGLGYFHLVGRRKDIIRRSGENIAAREVEAALTALPQVVEAAVVPVPDPVRGQEVKAYLVLAPGLSPDEVPPSAVLAHCASRLARFKVPRFIAYVTALPRTASNKVAKSELIARHDARAGAYDAVERRWL